MELNKPLDETTPRSAITLTTLAQSHKPAFWFLMPSLLILTLFTFYPMLMTVYNSFFTTNIRGEASKFVGLQNYVTIFQDALFWKSLTATVIYVVAFALLTIVGAMALARLATMKLRRISWFQTAFAGTMGTSAAATAILWLFLFNPSVGVVSLALKALGIMQTNMLVDPTGALVIVIISSVWMGLGFAFLILLSAFQSVPQDYYEVADIAGFSPWRQTLKITIPMISPTLFFLFVVEVIDGFKMFALIDLVTAGGPNNATNFLAYKIYQDAFAFHNFGIASAESIVLTVLIALATWVQFRYTERKVFYA